jgi:hypothetical protein
MKIGGIKLVLWAHQQYLNCLRFENSELESNKDEMHSNNRNNTDILQKNVQDRLCHSLLTKET